jgi:hypothetical protein
MSPATTVLDKAAFLRRLTLPKLAAALQRLPGDGVVAAFQLWLQTVTAVDLAAQETIDGVGYLEAIGILTAGEAAAVLALPTPAETGAGSWYVEYDGTTHELVREGPDPIALADVGANGLVVYAQAPQLFDPFTGRRLRWWDAAALDYVERS